MYFFVFLQNEASDCFHLLKSVAEINSEQRKQPALSEPVFSRGVGLDHSRGPTQPQLFRHFTNNNLLFFRNN